MKIKELIRIILTIAVIVLIVGLVNVIRNYIILKQIYNSNLQAREEMRNYYYENNTNYEFGETKNLRTQLKVYNGRYLQKVYKNNNLNTISWMDVNANEGISLNKETGSETTIKDKEIEMSFLLFGYEENKLKISDIIGKYLIRPIITQNECYVIEIENATIYIDKETKLIRKLVAIDFESSFYVMKDTENESSVSKELIYE